MSETTERLSSALADRYRIKRRLGEGGMATVYLAEDLKHKRKVALKVLKPELAAVLGAERFVQEITTTARLQHPHILPLFDSGEADSFLYYVMPYIEGETLREKLDRETQLSVDEAVRITSEVGDALDYAHRRGVIHRDIKPENILLHDGRPMVADFGIALAVSAAAGGRMTETGLSLGTPHYMSPEQATAEKDLTARSDVYSLGSVLYEMLTGDPPHTGSSAQQIIMKIVTDEARPVTELRKSVPPHVAAAVGKALERLPADRFESAAAFREALRDARIMATAVAGVRAQETAARSNAVPGGWLTVAAVVVVSAAVGWILHRPATPAPQPVTRFTIPVPEGHDMIEYLPNLALSPDGRTLAYFSKDTLWKRELQLDEPEPLGQLVDGCCPQYSTDGEWIYVLRGGSLTQNMLWMSTDGGPFVDAARRLSGDDIVFASWSARAITLRRKGDTTWVPVTELSDDMEGTHVWPQLLDDGRLVLFTILGPDMMWANAAVVVQDLETGERTTVVTEGTFGRYVPTGHVVYIRADGTVEAVPFDVGRRAVTGPAVVVAEGVRTGYWAGAGSFAVSDGGTFAFVRGSSWELHQLTWVDRQGTVLGVVGDPVTVEGIALSPDDRYAATYVASANADIARFDVVTGEMRRLTFDPTTEDNPAWSPDGSRVAYRKGVSGTDHRILAQRVDGQGEVEELFAAERFVAPRTWSPDGLALSVDSDGTLLIVHIDTQKVDTIGTTGTSNGAFSPDGRWFAFTSSETGRQEIYVVSYPGLTARQQISTDGGRLPRWSRASGELFFINGDTMMVTEVSTSAGLDWTTPRSLFAAPDLTTVIVGYGVSADGRRILYPARNPDAPAREIHVVLNWFEELKTLFDD